MVKGVRIHKTGKPAQGDVTGVRHFALNLHKNKNDRQKTGHFLLGIYPNGEQEKRFFSSLRTDFTLQEWRPWREDFMCKFRRS